MRAVFLTTVMEMRDIINAVARLDEGQGRTARNEEVLADLLSIRDGRHHSVEFDFDVDEGSITIDQISVEWDAQRSGLGSDLMWKICDVADRHGLAIKLEAASVKKFNRGEIGQRALENWYARFGFRKTGERSGEGHPIMVREPTAISA